MADGEKPVGVGANVNAIQPDGLTPLMGAAQNSNLEMVNLLLVGHAGTFLAMLPLLLTNVDYAFGAQHVLGNTALVIGEQQKEGLVCLEWDGLAR